MKNLVLDIRQVGKDRQIVEVENGSVFIKMGEWTYYLDNSTGEEILERWKTDDSFRSVEDYSEQPTWERKTEYHN
jgi:hypothetical protein